MLEKGVKFIGGLLHHGSGPGDTSLIDPDFPAKFAAFAARAAERYPWIESWTPINEPLTAARFSALYGHWYPHRKDPISFSRALMNQRSEEHTSELQSLMRISYAVFCLKKKNNNNTK